MALPPPNLAAYTFRCLPTSLHMSAVLQRLKASHVPVNTLPLEHALAGEQQFCVYIRLLAPDFWGHHCVGLCALCGVSC